jgi:MoaA/NifB/PqqE/SkfB family radical SAM enzyme
MDELLDYIIETERDTIFTTNATLLNRYAPKLGRLKNAMYIVSIDGDQDTNDRIRGKGTFQRIKENLANLKECCLEESGLMPLLSMNFCISEYIVSSDIIRAYKAAKELGLLNINYGLRWFVTDRAGRDYERQLREEFQVSASDSWKALRCDFSSFEAKGRFRLPYVSITPREAKSTRQIERHFLEHSYSFSRDKCLFPFYFVRLHSNGDVIFCPGYRDIIAGNAFYDDFYKVINSDIARKFRKFCLCNRFSICSKCCGLYLSYAVDKLARNELIG